MSVEAANVTLVTLLRRDLARALILDGQIVPAEKEYRKILEVDPDDGEAHLGLGRVSRTRHRYEEALEHLKKADASLQNNVEVIFELARLYNGLGRFEEAESGFERMLSLFGNPGDSFGAVRNRSISLTHLGLAAQELGKFEKAAGHFQELKRLGEAYAGHDRETLKVLGKENKHRARVLLIGLYRAARQVPRALDVCTAARGAGGDSSHKVRFAPTCWRRVESPKKRCGNWRGCSRATTEDLEIYHYILQIYQREKRFEEAEKKTLRSREVFRA